jgi:hypothetical protein
MFEALANMRRECEAVRPKEIIVNFITWMNRERLRVDLIFLRPLTARLNARAPQHPRTLKSQASHLGGMC